MSVRVVARIRPLLKLELDKDIIVTAESSGTEKSGSPTVVRIPNPKNDIESFSFQFNSVYDQSATQQILFDNEVAPTVKHLFNGFDVTIFAYGVTGTGKTHTMRGGKSLADRGVIPRLLSSIYRRSRKMEKDTAGETTVDVVMSYYEIYNDKVFDLFEPPEKRTPAGLPIRDNHGKTVVVGLTERPCGSLKDFEQLYDQANLNRSTSATKLNAHSSRSHAILCVKVVQTTGDTVRMSTASAIDLAGSEDNRRTENNKDRMVESASINKSLFVLAQCVEAISKKQSRIPYRESKMTRILSLGQNNGLTLMVLNLAPVRSYHLDTLSSLNFANRTKKIEICEIENEPILKGQGKAATAAKIHSAPSMQRQPLRPLTSAHNIILADAAADRKVEKPVKAFAVYSDSRKPPANHSSQANSFGYRQPKPLRPAGNVSRAASRPAATQSSEPALSKETIQALIDARVSEQVALKLASAQASSSTVTQPPMSNELQRRLEMLEQRIDARDDSDGRAEGLHYLFMAKQHQAREEWGSALRMCRLAQSYFPGNKKLEKKIRSLEEKMKSKQSEELHSEFPEEDDAQTQYHFPKATAPKSATHGSRGAKRRVRDSFTSDNEFEPAAHSGSEDELERAPRPRPTAVRKPLVAKQLRKENVRTIDADLHLHESTESVMAADLEEMCPTPRTRAILNIINSRDISQIRSLKGVGSKRAENIISALNGVDYDDFTCSDEDEDDTRQSKKRKVLYVDNLEALASLKGVGGIKAVERMREGIEVGVM